MSEETPGLRTESSAQTAAPAAATAGALLRQAREAAGLHIAALAVSMKVPVKKLEALEADRLDLLPDAVFVRALAASMCRALRMDPAPVLQRLPQTTIPRLDSESRGINAPFHASNQSASLSVSLPGFLRSPVVWFVGLLLALAVVLLVLPRIPGWTRSPRPCPKPCPYRCNPVQCSKRHRPKPHRLPRRPLPLPPCRWPLHLHPLPPLPSSHRPRCRWLPRRRR